MISRLNLDFSQAGKPFYARWTLSGLLILLLGGGLMALCWQQYQLKQDEAGRLTEELHRLQLKQENPKKLLTVTSPVAMITPEQIQALHAISGELATPWDDLFYALEEAGTNDIAVLGIQPDRKKQQITIAAEAKNYEVALTYIDHLTKQPMLSDVYLQKHAVNESDKDKPIRFTVHARWLLER